MSKDQRRAVDIVRDYTPVVVPYDVWHLFGSQCKSIEFASDRLSFGEDYASIEEARLALEFYVEQLGGKIKWEK